MYLTAKIPYFNIKSSKNISISIFLDFNSVLNTFRYIKLCCYSFINYNVIISIVCFIKILFIK